MMRSAIVALLLAGGAEAFSYAPAALQRSRVLNPDNATARARRRPTSLTCLMRDPKQALKKNDPETKSAS